MRCVARTSRGAITAKAKRMSSEEVARPVVLFVDDCRATRTAAKELLDDEGYQVAVAGNGEEALALFAQLQPAIVLTDVQMPRMGGYELLSEIKSQSPATPVVLMTANNEIDAERAAAGLGAAGLINKPMDLEDLLEVIRRVTCPCS